MEEGLGAVRLAITDFHGFENPECTEQHHNYLIVTMKFYHNWKQEFYTILHEYT